MIRLYQRFKYSILGLFLAGLFSSLASAQSTTVSVTVVDPTSQVWANGTITYQFVGNGNFNGQYQWQGANLPTNYLTPTTVQLNGSGAATFSIPTSTTINPSGSSWKYIICPNASVACGIVNISAIGNTQNISSTVTAALTPISTNGSNVPLAYTDSQIKVAPFMGAIYYNTTSNVTRQWNGTSWVNLASVGGLTPAGTSVNQVQVRNSSGTALGYSATTLDTAGNLIQPSTATSTLGNINFSGDLTASNSNGSLVYSTNQYPSINTYSSSFGGISQTNGVIGATGTSGSWANFYDSIGDLTWNYAGTNLMNFNTQGLLGIPFATIYGPGNNVCVVPVQSATLSGTTITVTTTVANAIQTNDILALVQMSNATFDTPNLGTNSATVLSNTQFQVTNSGASGASATSGFVLRTCVGGLFMDNNRGFGGLPNGLTGPQTLVEFLGEVASDAYHTSTWAENLVSQSSAGLPDNPLWISEMDLINNNSSPIVAGNTSAAPKYGLDEVNTGGNAGTAAYRTNVADAGTGWQNGTWYSGILQNGILFSQNTDKCNNAGGTGAPCTGMPVNAITYGWPLPGTSTYTPGHAILINAHQFSNADDAIVYVRNTDISPTGNLLQLLSSTGTDIGSINTLGQVNWPSYSGTGTATFTLGAAGGSGATAVCTTGHICDSFSGEITYTVGTIPITGILVTIGLSLTRQFDPNCVVDTISSTGIVTTNYWTESVNAIVLNAATALVASTPYSIHYICGSN